MQYHLATSNIVFENNLNMTEFAFPENIDELPVHEKVLELFDIASIFQNQNDTEW